MLAGRVPRADDEHEAGADATFEYALQGTQDDEVGKVFGEADAQDDHTPAEHIDRQCPAHLVSLQEEVGGELETHVSHVESGRQPCVLLSHEMSVLG